MCDTFNPLQADDARRRPRRRPVHVLVGGRRGAPTTRPASPRTSDAPSPPRSRTTTRSRRAASRRSAPTSRTASSTACSTARSAAATSRSRRRPAASTSSRSTTRPAPVVDDAARSAVRSDAFYAWAERPDARALAERLRGFRPPLQPDPFEALVTSITAQQVSLFSAVAIRNRLIERFGERVGEAWAFPTRERIAAAHEDELFAVGFTRRKAEYAVALARSDIDLDALALLPDDEVRATITAQRGLGPWTAEWFLARHLARPQRVARRRPGAPQGGAQSLRCRGARARRRSCTRSRTCPRTIS